MKTRNVISVLTIFIAVLFLITGCGNNYKTPTSVTASGGRSALQAGGPNYASLQAQIAEIVAFVAGIPESDYKNHGQFISFPDKLADIQSMIVNADPLNSIANEIDDLMKKVDGCGGDPAGAAESNDAVSNCSTQVTVEMLLSSLLSAVEHGGLASITISPAGSLSIAVGDTAAFNLTNALYEDGTSAMSLVDGKLNWSSSNFLAGTVAPAVGNNTVLTGIAAGATQVTASVFNVTSNSVDVTVTGGIYLISITIPVPPGPIEAPVNMSNPVPPLACVYSDGSTEDCSPSVTWASTDPSVAYVQSGIFYSLSIGETFITASLDGVTSNAAHIVVIGSSCTSEYTCITDPNECCSGQAKWHGGGCPGYQCIPLNECLPAGVCVDDDPANIGQPWGGGWECCDNYISTSSACGTGYVCASPGCVGDNQCALDPSNCCSGTGTYNAGHCPGQYLCTSGGPSCVSDGACSTDPRECCSGTARWQGDGCPGYQCIPESECLSDGVCVIEDMSNYGSPPTTPWGIGWECCSNFASTHPTCGAGGGPGYVCGP